jgi:hypothetical protein
MSNFAFPSELNYQQLASMYPSTKRLYKRSPVTGAGSYNGGGTEIQMVLNKQENTFWDMNTLALSFTVTWTTDANTSAYLIGGGYSFFNRQVTTALASGTKLETIQNVGQIVNTIHNMTLTQSEKFSLVHMGYGGYRGDTNVTKLVLHADNASDKVQSFAIPIVGVLNSSKLIPAFVSDIEIDFTLAAISDFMTVSNTVGATLPTNVVLSNIEICCEAITLEGSAMQQLLSMHPSILSTKSSSLMYGSATLPVNSAGIVDVQYTHSLASLKELIWWASPAGNCEKNFGGVNPNIGAGGWQFIVNGEAKPSQPVRCDKVAEVCYEMQKAWGSLYSASHSGSMSRDAMRKAVNAFGEYKAFVTALGTDALSDDDTNKFYNCLDLEVINNLKDSLFSGISTKDGTQTLRLNIATALGTACALHFFSHYDVIVDWDYVNRVVSVRQ